MAKEFESDDPWEIVGVVVPTAPGEDATGEMARALVEEFALMGYSPERLLRLFETPFYAGAHAIYRARGEAFVRQTIDAVLREGGKDA
ncbi:MAG: hypothetical protein Q8R28_17015 [Dehalococcoidia bacterium]|nr:hypothetical protein [Dehalococcoidia bacterium]